MGAFLSHHHDLASCFPSPSLILHSLGRVIAFQQNLAYINEKNRVIIEDIEGWEELT
jgi:hypothetical protein